MKGLTLTMKEQTRLCILNSVLEKRCSVSEASLLVGVSERHVWRLLAAYREEGAAALSHRNRNRTPANATSPILQEQVISLARNRYFGVNHTHFTELLADWEKIKLSRSTVRRLLIKAGLPSPKHRQPPSHRYRRERMPQEGMLIQIDGSHHSWLEERGPWFTLLLAIDDATGSVPYALFQDQEDTNGYFHLMKGIIQQKGIPLAVYSDRYLVFRPPMRKEDAKETSLGDGGKLTQFGRAMQELGITQVFAHSPEAKGRIERANGTFQDRLVSELRLAGISTLEDANKVLQEFLPRFNERFGVPATQPEPAYRLVGPELDIDGILCIKERRRVAKDNTIQYRGKTLQLYPGTERRSYARAYVEVQERLDGQTLVCCREKILTPKEAPPLATSLRTQAAVFTEYFYPPEDNLYSELGEWDYETESTLQRRLMWYEDSEMKVIHRNLVKAGMEKARQRGKRIGRPKVTERPEFLQRFNAIVERLQLDEISRRKAAGELGIGYATLKRLLDAK
jgi:transposase